MQDKSFSTVKSATRVLEIFEYFDVVQKPQKLTDLAKGLDYPTSSTLSLLKSLQALEYLSYDPATRTYMPTLRLPLLGEWVKNLIYRDGALTRMMERIQEDTGETVVLGVQNDVFCHYVHVVQARSLLRFYLKPGTLRPMCRSASGLVLLAEQPREAVVKLVNRVNTSGSDKDRVIDVDEVLAKLEVIREQGYAYTSNQITPGAGTFAMVLPKIADQPAMAVGVGGPTSRLEPNAEVVVNSMRSRIAEYRQEA